MLYGVGSLASLCSEETDGGVRYSWHAWRMSRAYLSERDEILGLGSDAGKDM